MPALVATEWASHEIAPQTNTSVSASRRQANFSMVKAWGSLSICSEAMFTPAASKSIACPVTSKTGETLPFQNVIAILMAAPMLYSTCLSQWPSQEWMYTEIINNYPF